ncbi:hypothetical protein KC19_2G293700 [Ceratodon purpureus]|uniref:Uncharacterized protein n=1 Tax=Ceratodon purpureus TaxID=3225 RepID=A0A8T0J0K2_CERPU|nr:hypothetical protein KC19_2G293700 [Ceratodon purpureus]
MFVERGWGCGSYASRNVSEVRTRQESKLTKVPPLTVPPLLARDGREGRRGLGLWEGGREEGWIIQPGLWAAGQRGSGAAGQRGSAALGTQDPGRKAVTVSLSLSLSFSFSFSVSVSAPPALT